MLYYLNGIFVGFLLLSNVLAVKIFSITEWIMLPGAVVLVVVTYPLIDVITEVYGKEASKRTVRAGFITQILAVFFIYIVIALPPAPAFTEQIAFETILGGSVRVIIASLIAYFVSVNLDVIIFSKIKERLGAKHLWLRNNVSTMLSQLVDTALFISIAFYGIMPTSVLFSLFLAQYAFKFIAAILATPLVYGLVFWARKLDH